MASYALRHPETQALEPRCEAIHNDDGQRTGTRWPLPDGTTMDIPLNPSDEWVDALKQRYRRIAADVHRCTIKQSSPGRWTTVCMSCGTTPWHRTRSSGWVTWQMAVTDALQHHREHNPLPTLPLPAREDVAQPRSRWWRS